MFLFMVIKHFYYQINSFVYFLLVLFFFINHKSTFVLYNLFVIW